MMGLTHALTGALAWSWLAHANAVHPVVHGAGMVVTAGAALWPDVDHPGSTVSRCLGPITWTLCRVVQSVTGGHRRGTHSLTGCAVLVGLVHVAVQARSTHWAGSVGLALLLAVLLTAVVRLARIKGWTDELLAATAGAGLAFWPGLDLTLLPAAVGIGTLVHLLGDMVTRQGIPILWPFSSQRVSLAGFKAGGWTERWVVLPAAVVGLPVVTFWEPLTVLWA